MQRRITKYRINSQHKIVVPIHYHGNHWLFILIGDGVIKLYDSMNNTVVPQSLIELTKQIYGSATVEIVQLYPKQAGYEDCGVFMLCGIKSLVYGLQTWGFRQGNINYKRLCIARDIQCGVIGRINPLANANA